MKGDVVKFSSTYYSVQTHTLIKGLMDMENCKKIRFFYTLPTLVTIDTL